MLFTPVDIAERNAFVEQTLEATQIALADPSFERFQRHSRFYRQLLDGAVVANYGVKGIEVPSNIPPDTDRLVIVAVGRDDVPLMSPGLDIQTSNQKRATIKTFRSWDALPSAGVVYEDLLEADKSTEDPLPYPIHPLTLAMTGTFANLLDLSRPAHAEHFADAPTEGIVQIQKRPIVMLVMGKSPHVRGEVLAHELAHVRQITENPVKVFRSQKSIDMANLRDELEAYHLGADTAYIENGSQPVDLILPEGGADLQNRLQSIVESLRRAHGVDPIDPYRPSPSLLKMMSGLGEIVLHQRLDFDTLCSMFED